LVQDGPVRIVGGMTASRYEGRRASATRGRAATWPDAAVSSSGTGQDSERATSTLGERLEEARLHHRAAKLDRVVGVLRTRASAYEETPHELRLALSDFEAS
jgi:hypothetical protein